MRSGEMQQHRQNVDDHRRNLLDPDPSSRVNVVVPQCVDVERRDEPAPPATQPRVSSVAVASRCWRASRDQDPREHDCYDRH